MSVYKWLSQTLRNYGDYYRLKDYERLLYNGLFCLGANFPEWWALNFSRNFPDLEIHDRNYQKYQMRNISPKAYMCNLSRMHHYMYRYI